MKVTAERLREVLHYDPETGAFTWLVSLGRVRAGAVAGEITRQGYRLIQIDGQRYPAHRLAWFYMTGAWPADEVDHRNTVPGDDRWANLREATSAQNSWNTPKRRNNTSGVKGVTRHPKSGKWHARIRVNNGRVHLGYFTDINEAAAAYAAASKKFHGEFARTE